jgi:hypothetical protein
MYICCHPQNSDIITFLPNGKYFAIRQQLFQQYYIDTQQFGSMQRKDNPATPPPPASTSPTEGTTDSAESSTTEPPSVVDTSENDPITIDPTIHHIRTFQEFVSMLLQWGFHWIDSSSCTSEMSQNTIVPTTCAIPIKEDMQLSPRPYQDTNAAAAAIPEVTLPEVVVFRHSKFMEGDYVQCQQIVQHTNLPQQQQERPNVLPSTNAAHPLVFPPTMMMEDNETISKIIHFHNHTAYQKVHQQVITNHHTTIAVQQQQQQQQQQQPKRRLSPGFLHQQEQEHNNGSSSKVQVVVTSTDTSSGSIGANNDHPRSTTKNERKVSSGGESEYTSTTTTEESLSSTTGTTSLPDMAAAVDHDETNDNSVTATATTTEHPSPAADGTNNNSIRSMALSIATEKLQILSSSSSQQNGTSSHHHRSLVDTAVTSCTYEIVTSAIECLLQDKKHSQIVYNKHEKELSRSSLPGLVPVCKQIFATTTTDASDTVTVGPTTTTSSSPIPTTGTTATTTHVDTQTSIVRVVTAGTPDMEEPNNSGTMLEATRNEPPTGENSNASNGSSY